MTFLDPAFEAAAGKALSRGYCPDGVLAHASALQVKGSRSVADLAHFTRLERLILSGHSTRSLNELGPHEGLASLKVEFGPLRTLVVEGLPALHTLDVACNAIEDVEPLFDHPSLWHVDLRGNPLTERSYRERAKALLADIRSRVLEPRWANTRVVLPGEEAWRLTRMLRERGLEANVLDRGSGAETWKDEELTLITPTSRGRRGKGGIRVDAETLRRVALKVDDAETLTERMAQEMAGRA